MKASIQHILASISASLETEVLPHLEPAAAPASNVRACLMMLAYVERRISLDPQFLFQDNHSLRALLHDAERNADSLAVDEGLRAKITDALAQYPQRPASFNVVEAAAENEAYQNLLTCLIKMLAGQRHERGRAEHRAFRMALHRYLRERGKRDIQYVGNALKHVPV